MLLIHVLFRHKDNSVWTLANEHYIILSFMYMVTFPVIVIFLYFFNCKCVYLSHRRFRVTIYSMSCDVIGRTPVGYNKHEQTCAKVPKRFQILGSLSPRSGTLMDLGPCTSFLPWDSGNPGPQNCVMPQDPGNPGPQDFDMQ